ncbi:hypothetical protein P7C73_g5220, partial [Tremellales sp. Uapishka_1]
MSIFSTIINYLFPPDPSTPASPPAPSVSPLNPPRSPLRYFSTPTAPEHHHLTPSPRDIQQVTAILSKRLPPELVPRILEFAEYFSGCRRFNPRKFNVTAGGVLPRGKRGVLFSTGQETELQVEMAMEGSGLKDELGNYWYLVSEPVGCGDHDGEEEEESDRPPSWLRGIVLETKSKDQGWTSANPQFYGRIRPQRKGKESGSSAGIPRQLRAAHNVVDGGSSAQRSGQSVRLVPEGKKRYVRGKGPRLGVTDPAVQCEYQKRQFGGADGQEEPTDWNTAGPGPSSSESFSSPQVGKHHLGLLPSPAELIPFFVSTEQRFLFHHYLHESAHSLLVLPAPAPLNPWITLHARLALRTSSASDPYENALRKAILAYASFEIGFRRDDSGFVLDENGLPRENSIVLQSQAQRDESLELLNRALQTVQPGADDLDVALATCLSLVTLDRISAGIHWHRPLTLACSLITSSGGTRAFIAARDTPTRRFLCEQITCYDVIGSFVRDVIPTLLEAWDDWWYGRSAIRRSSVAESDQTVDDFPDGHDDSVPGGFGIDRGVMEYLSRVARVNATAQGLYQIAPQARQMLSDATDSSPTLDPVVADMRKTIELEVAHLLLEAPFWQTDISTRPISRVALGNNLMSHAISIHLLWTTMGVPPSDPKIVEAVTAVLDLLDIILAAGTVTRGLLTALGQAAFCAIGPQRIRARQVLQKLAPSHTRDLTRSQIVVDMVWQEAAALRFINEIDSRALATTYPAPLLASNSYINPDIASQDLATGDQYDVRMARSSMPSTFVETGSMPNPASSDPERNEEFEEIWHSLELPRGSPVIFLESVDGGPGKGKAFLASVGRWQLGLMDDGEGKYFAWRDEVEDGTWRNIYSIGDDPKSVVVPLLELPQRWQAGQTVEHGGREWIVREIGLSEAEKGEPRWD